MIPVNYEMVFFLQPGRGPSAAGLTPGDLIAADVGCLLGDFVGDVDFKQIPNGTAASANQMGVGGDIGVEMLLPIDDAYPIGSDPRP